jgi:hypothetical protein
MATFPHSTALPRSHRPTALPRPRRAPKVLRQTGLVLAMSIGSLALWAGSPVAWLWVASRASDSPTPGMGPYLVLFGGFIGTSLGLGRILAALDRAYRRVGAEPHPRVHPAFLLASGQEKHERPNPGPLGIIMTVSVVVAAVALVTYVVIVGQPFIPLPL